jgi:hypothetical protein
MTTHPRKVPNRRNTPGLASASMPEKLKSWSEKPEMPTLALKLAKISKNPFKPL